MEIFWTRSDNLARVISRRHQQVLGQTVKTHAKTGSALILKRSNKSSDLIRNLTLCRKNRFVKWPLQGGLSEWNVIGVFRASKARVHTSGRCRLLLGGGGVGESPQCKKWIQHVCIRDPNAFWGYFSAWNQAYFISISCISNVLNVHLRWINIYQSPLFVFIRQRHQKAITRHSDIDTCCCLAGFVVVVVLPVL